MLSLYTIAECEKRGNLDPTPSKSEKAFSSSNLCKSQMLIITAQTSMAVYMHLHWDPKQCQRE